MKLVAGVVLAGAVAAGVTALSSGGSESLPAEGPPVPVEEHAHDQKYRLVPAAAARVPENGTYLSRGYIAGVLNGPGLGAEYTSVSDATSDGRGNAYWTVSGTFPIVRRWNVESDRVTTVAGSDADVRSAGASSGGGGPTVPTLQVGEASTPRIVGRRMNAPIRTIVSKVEIWKARLVIRSLKSRAATR